MQFELTVPSRIMFGDGIISTIAPVLRQMGQRVFLIVGEKGADSSQILRVVNEANLDYLSAAVKGEPTIHLIDELLTLCRDFRPDIVLAFGGGSVIDAGKAVAVLMNNPGPVTDYLEVIGAGKELTNPGLPIVAIPTTSGTGAEVTRNAVLGVPEKRVKVSLRSAYLLPRLVVVDPQLTYSLPPEVTASTGMDALTQVLEPFISRKANAMTDIYCREGMRRIGGSFLTAYRDGSNEAARSDMSFGSLLGGLSLANAGLGAVHGFAGPIGGMFDASHGVICARLLPAVIEHNVKAFRRDKANTGLVSKITEAAQIITRQEDATPEGLVEWLADLCTQMNIPTSERYGHHRIGLRGYLRKGGVCQQHARQSGPIRFGRTSPNFTPVLVRLSNYRDQPFFQFPNGCRESLDEITVVDDCQNGAFEALQRFFKPNARWNVQVIDRFVQ